MATNYNIVWSGPKLDGKLDYNYWALLMSTHLKAHNIWSFIEPGLQQGADDATKRKDQLALSQIHQGVDYSIFGKIANAKTAKEAWEILKLSYKGVEKAQKSKLQSLRREYERYEMSSSETVEQYFSRVMDLVNKMRVYGEKIEDKNVVEKILRTMPMKYDHVVTTIIESHDTDIMTVAELQGSLESHISRILEKTEKVSEEALKSQVNLDKVVESSQNSESRSGDNSSYRGRGSWRGRGRGNCGGRGRGSFNQRRGNNFGAAQGRGGNNYGLTNRGRGRGNYYQEKTNYSCYNCGKFGHRAADCRFKQQANIAENQYEHTGESSDNPQTLLLAANNFSGDGDIWYLDTGCSNHMCGKKELFFSLDETVKSTVKFGNNSNIPILGKGRVAIRLKDGSQNYISDVFYAPGLHHNLLSMGQLSEKGYNMQIHDGYCTLIDKNRRFIAKVKMTPNRLFPLRVQHDKIPCLSSIIQNDDWLWHMRFGHYHFSGLNFLSRKEYVSGLPVINIPKGICETCEIGKKHRESFPTGKSWRARKPLEIVHSDLCMVEIPTHGGSRYFITFIDDFSRKAWVYFLKHKSEACDSFKLFKSFVEKQSGCKIKALRTDRGQEYLTCADFLDQHGIQQQLTTRYTPQQNGVAERKNRTIMDMVRCMLKAKQMPREFWAEAVSTAVYILNRCPTKSVCDKTPEEAWSGRKPSIWHLRVFGCIAYAHVPDQLRKKLDDKGEKCIFIGYSTNSKAYKLYNPVTKKVIISRDVTFDEEGMWDWSFKTQKEPSINPENYEEENGHVDPTPDEPETSSRPQRQRKLPARLEDYVVGNDNDPSDEEIINFALFAYCEVLGEIKSAPTFENVLESRLASYFVRDDSLAIYSSTVSTVGLLGEMVCTCFNWLASSVTKKTRNDSHGLIGNMLKLQKPFVFKGSRGGVL
ncbi:hypothetical protein GQ457_09G024580 [Hibiscus cannabinus]